jgi:hypothetical protein
LQLAASLHAAGREVEKAQRAADVAAAAQAAAELAAQDAATAAAAGGGEVAGLKARLLQAESAIKAREKDVEKLQKTLLVRGRRATHAVHIKQASGDLVKRQPS